MKVEARKQNATSAYRRFSACRVHGADAASAVFGVWFSDFFRPSVFGLRILATVSGVCLPFIGLAAESNDSSDVPTSSLRPPRGEILPSFWEQYATWVILGAFLFLVLVGLGVWLMIRPRAAVPVPFSTQARGELDPLRQQPEDGKLLSRTSQILRHYIAAMFGLPPGELTTNEFCAALTKDQKIGPELAKETSEFLRTCDLCKFAPSPPMPPPGVVGRALGIIDHAENRLVELKRLAEENVKLDGDHSQKAGQPQGLPSGA
jgi:hypothetical protein